MTNIGKKALLPGILAFALCLNACGGGGGGGSDTGSTTSTGSTGSTSTGSGGSTSSGGSGGTTGTQAAIVFNNSSVHDPAVVPYNGSFYIFGSHLVAAKSTDLMNWTTIASGVNDSNPLFTNVTTELAKTFAWSTVTDLWRPSVIHLADGKFYMYYDSGQGSRPLSALGVAVADKIEGPYVDKGIILESGMAGLSSDGVTNYNQQVQPNTIDPSLFHDNNGKLWMIYGSYSGGIFILAMDESTGLPLSGQGYGKHLMGGNNSRIEGSSVMYSPSTKYYYMFVAFGGLDAAGGYNIRVSRSVNPDGPYLDAAGNDMSKVMSNASLPLFDDASIAPYAEKLMGNYQYALAANESGTAVGYVSPGGSSTYYQASTNQYFLIFHTRFPNQGEYFENRVHEMFINADGWPVIAPFRYVPLSQSTTSLSSSIASSEVPGIYKIVNHGKDISATIKTSQNITLNADGSVSGTQSGSWTYQGSNNVTLTLTGVGTFDGVLSRQWNPNANTFEVTFSVLSSGGVSIWGVRTGS